MAPSIRRRDGRGRDRAAGAWPGSLSAERVHRVERADPVRLVRDVPRLRRRRQARPVRLPLRHLVAAIDLSINATLTGIGRALSAAAAVRGVAVRALPQRRRRQVRGRVRGGRRRRRRAGRDRTATPASGRSASRSASSSATRTATAGPTSSSPTTPSATSSSTTSPDRTAARRSRRRASSSNAARAEGQARGGDGHRLGRVPARASAAWSSPTSPTSRSRSSRPERGPRAAPVLRLGPGGRPRRAEPVLAQVRHLLLRLRPRRPARPADLQRPPRAGDREGPGRPAVRPAGATVLEHRRPGARLRAGDGRSMPARTCSSRWSAAAAPSSTSTATATWTWCWSRTTAARAAAQRYRSSATSRSA